MGRKQKIIATTLWAALILVMVGVVVGQFWSRRDVTLPTFYSIADYNLTDQNGKPFGSADLRGKPYVASIIFTNCGDICPLMTAHLKHVQIKTPAGLQLVSMTVDPERDTPGVLKQYAANYGADETRWHFLTGSKQQMEQAEQGLRLPVMPGQDKQPIVHSDKFLLIDGDGNLRGIYNGKDEKDLTKLIADAKSLLAHEGQGPA